MAEAAVIGVPEPVYGDSIMAFVVPMPGESPDAEAVIEHVENNTAPFKSPEKIIMAETLPKSAVGKILKRKLREMAVLEAKKA